MLRALGDVAAHGARAVPGRGGGARPSSVRVLGLAARAGCWRRPPCGLTSTTVNTLYIATAATRAGARLARRRCWRSRWACRWRSSRPRRRRSKRAASRRTRRCAAPTGSRRGIACPRQLALGGRRSCWRAAALVALGPVGGLPVFGYAAAFAIVFGIAFLVPAVLCAARARSAPGRSRRCSASKGSSRTPTWPARSRACRSRSRRSR